jgi:hypothetical protein
VIGQGERTTFITVHAPFAEAFAPVIQKLRGERQ